MLATFDSSWLCPINATFYLTLPALPALASSWFWIMSQSFWHSNLKILYPFYIAVTSLSMCSPLLTYHLQGSLT